MAGRKKGITTLKQQLALGIEALGASKVRSMSGGENTYAYKSAKGKLIEITTGSLVDVGRRLADGQSLDEMRESVWIGGAHGMVKDNLP